MDIILSPIGSGSRHYSNVTDWEADHRIHPDVFNVGVLYNDSTVDDYETFLKLEGHNAGFSHFVLMTETGVVLGSCIANRFHKVHESFPPVKPSPYSTVEGTDTEEIIGHGAEHNLEEIARTYIQQRLDDYDPSLDRSEVKLAIQTCSRTLARLIAEDPESLNEIEWRELEKLLAEAFAGIGYSVTLTHPSKDGGKDIILECHPPSGRRTYFVEVKHWRSEQKVGGKTIRDFHRVVVREKVCGGLFLSTYGVTGNALEQLTEVERRKIRIGTETKVVALCRSYVSSTYGVLLPSTELPEYLFTETLPISA